MSKKFLSPIKLAQGASVPSTGSSGELFYNTTDAKIYTHNGTAWVASGGGVTNSATAPSNPVNGDAWFNTEEGTLFVYYNDGDSGQWVEASNNISNAEPNQIPAGAMMAWGSSVIPNNWLLCDGAAVSRETYASLFAAIGTTYGAGNGTTTFNLPNLKGRTIAGLDSSQTEFDSLGETGGAKTHTLTVDQIPSHNHLYYDYLGAAAGGSIDNKYVAGASSTGGVVNASTFAHEAGGGQAHNNLQPYIVLNYIIKFSAGETPGDSELATRVGAVEAQNNSTPLSQNYIINGGFDIWQRGAGPTTGTNAFFGPDRWMTYGYAANSATIQRVAFSPGELNVAGIEPQYFTRITSTNNQVWFTQKIEDVRTLAGRTATVSFWVKSATAQSGASVYFSQTFGTGGSAGLDTAVQTFSIGTTWQRVSLTFAIPSISGKTVGANSLLGLTITAAINNAFDIWGVQLEEGSFATPFRRNSPNLQAELAACQRYYQVWGNSGWNYEQIGWGQVIASTVTRVRVDFKTTMRIAPASPGYTAVGDFNVEMAGAAFAGTVSVIDNFSSTTNSCTFNVTHPANANWTNGKMCGFVTNNTTNARFFMSAEL